LEGDKTIAYELFEQLKGFVPEYIFVPIGTGPLLTGIYKGYEELKELGFTNKLPKMIGVQAMGCAPIVKAYNENRDKVEPWDLVDTIASGISDPLKGYSQDGTYTLKTIKNSKGCAISVNDEEILKSVLVLGKQQGLYVEPTSASVISAYENLRKMNIITQSDLVVGILTGIGFKDTKPLISSLNSIPLIEPTFDKFKEIEMLKC
jgi:threonine synthase